MCQLDICTQSFNVVFSNLRQDSCEEPSFISSNLHIFFNHQNDQF